MADLPTDDFFLHEAVSQRTGRMIPRRIFLSDHNHFPSLRFAGAVAFHS
jgi:hypothetical protein